MPQGVVAEQKMDNFERCSLYMIWSAPSNIANRDVNRFVVYVNGTVSFNETNDKRKNLTLAVYPVCSCGAHNVSVSAVNRCGQMGQSTPTITLDENPIRLPQRDCADDIDPSCAGATTEGGKNTIYYRKTEFLCEMINKK